MFEPLEPLEVPEPVTDPRELYMCACDALDGGGGTTYLVVAARAPEEAIRMVMDENPARENVECLGDFLEWLDEEYGGLAVLNTDEGV